MRRTGVNEEDARKARLRGGGGREHDGAVTPRDDEQMAEQNQEQLMERLMEQQAERKFRGRVDASADASADDGASEERVKSG